MIRNLFILGILSLLIACSHGGREQLSPEGFKRWVSAHPNYLMKGKEYDQVKIQVKRILPEQRMLKQLEDLDTLIDQSFYESQLEKLAREEVYHLRISSKDGVHPLDLKVANGTDYFAKLEYYNHHVQKDLRLIVNGTDTLPCSFVHLERNYGAAPHLNIITAFNGLPKIKEEIQFIYQDRIFGIGRINYTYKADEVQHIPQVII